jgi:hypothetical protein
MLQLTQDRTAGFEDSVMTRMAKLVLLGAFVLGAGTFVFAQQQESLADVARKVTANKPAPPPNQKVYTNDDLQFHTVADTTSTSTDTSTDTDASKAKTTKKGPPPKSDDDIKAEKQKDWDKKLADQRQKIADLKREIDVITREQRLRDAAFYADAGNRLRNQEQYSQDVQKSKDELDAKQKQLQDAEQQLSDMQEEVRKAGLRDSGGQ